MSRGEPEPTIYPPGTSGESDIPYRYLKYQPEPPLALVTLDRPDAGNRLDHDLADELRQVCRAVYEDDTIHLVILTGSSDTFSVGREPPPAEVATEPVGARLSWLQQLQVAGAVATLEVPVIVAINGDAIDHGLELALAGDLRIAAANARFGLTDLAQGSFPWDGGTQRLPRLVGPAWAQDMILTSRVIDAGQALALGLVNRVVEANQVLEEARHWADSILSAGPIAARYAKEAVHKGTDLSLPQGIRLEADLNILLQGTADRAEGLKAFSQRRAPKYTGR